MAILRTRDIRKMNDKERKDKLKDLKFELVKANVSANKTNSKAKEIKRAVSRLLTEMKINKPVHPRTEELKRK